eukprot:Colp12_sorted_trinity150504_noHs@7506
MWRSRLARGLRQVAQLRNTPKRLASSCGKNSCEQCGGVEYIITNQYDQPKITSTQAFRLLAVGAGLVGGGLALNYQWGTLPGMEVRKVEKEGMELYAKRRAELAAASASADTTTAPEQPAEIETPTPSSEPVPEPVPEPEPTPVAGSGSESEPASEAAEEAPAPPKRLRHVKYLLIGAGTASH